MKVLILVGVVSDEKSGATPEILYCGLDGVALEEAARKGAESKKFSEIGKIVYPSTIPMAIVPSVGQPTKPVFPREEKQKKILHERHLKNKQLREDALREALLKRAGAAKQQATPAQQQQQQSQQPLRTDGPTLEEFVAGGGVATSYPPTGFAEKQSPALEIFRAEQAKKQSVQPGQDLPPATDGENSKADQNTNTQSMKQIESGAPKKATPSVVSEMKNTAAVLVALLLLCFGLNARAQTYYVNVPMPFSTISGGNTNLGGFVVNTVTNLGLGWSSVVSVTNITYLYNPTNAAFAWATNVTSTTNTTYADFDAIGRRYVVLEHAFSASGSSVSNVIVTIARSIDRTYFDTLNNLSVTNAANGPTNAVYLYQIDMGGYPYGRIVSLTWGSTNLAQVLTNAALRYSNIRQASASATGN